VLYSTGDAYEYHDFIQPTATSTANPTFFPWTSLGSGVKQAVAGQGVSYVLLTNGNLGEYVDPNYTTSNYGYGVNPGSRRGVIASGVSSIVAAGVDPLGVNAVEYTTTARGKTTTYVWRDINGSASTSTSGFTPGTVSEVIGNGGITASLLTMSDDTSTSTVQQTPQQTPPVTPAPNRVSRIILIISPTVGVDPIPGPSVTVTQRIDFSSPVVPPGEPLLPFRRPLSGTGPDNIELVEEDDMGVMPERGDSASLPYGESTQAPSRSTGLEAVRMESTKALWQVIGESACEQQEQPLSVPDEVWAAIPDQVALPIQDDSSTSALGLAAAALFPSVYFAETISRKRHVSTVRRGRLMK
jgi:hypothetical protein